MAACRAGPVFFVALKGIDKSSSTTSENTKSIFQARILL